jgi:hypothetical protein
MPEREPAPAVHIGTIEVRVEQERPSAPPPRAPAAAPAASGFDEYLGSRSYAR